MWLLYVGLPPYIECRPTNTRYLFLCAHKSTALTLHHPCWRVPCLLNNNNNVAAVVVCTTTGWLLWWLLLHEQCSGRNAFIWHTQLELGDFCRGLSLVCLSIWLWPQPHGYTTWHLTRASRFCEFHCLGIAAASPVSAVTITTAMATTLHQGHLMIGSTLNNLYSIVLLKSPGVSKKIWPKVFYNTVTKYLVKAYHMV